jgi:two-component system, cell cycle sensor histidine kinase and response regulator CckA
MLSVVLSYADLMLLDLAPQAPTRGDLEEIKSAAVRASELTRHLLAFSRQQVLEPRVLDLNETVGGLEKMLRRLLTESVDLRFAQGASLGRISADPSQVEQVLINLVVNARDAMPDGGTLSIETADVELDAEYATQHVDVTPGHYVMLAVTDTGVGMEPDVAARIFEPFFTTKGVGKGTGLGLASVFGFVRQSGGHIWVYSELGRGTCFKLYLPRVDRPADAPRDAAAASERSLEGTEAVLLVEDDDSVRALARTILRRSGYDVVEARSCDEAIDACTRHASKLRLLLTDTILPGMSGPDLATRLTSIAPGLKVLHMSGYADAAIINHKILERGAAFIQKPLTPRTLLRKVRDVLDGRGA